MMIPVSTSGAERIADARESLAPPRLAITVFGGIGISYGRSEVRLTGRKARALLAYLALSETGRETRERLAGLLWPETGEQNARASLRQVLVELRESLASCDCHALVAGRRDIELISDAIDVDLFSVLREIAVGRVPELLLIQPRIGETLLFGYDDLSPLFREWVVATRAHLQERLIRALEQGYENEVLPRRQRRLLAEAVLMLEPLHEAACRTVMRLAAEDGEIGPALRAYADLYRALDEELDMEPSGPTRELVAEIKQGRFDREAEPIRHPARPENSAYDPRQRAPSGVPVVAVLPFRAIGPDQVPLYFAEGVLEDTVRILAMLREPVVISSNSTREFRGPDIDLHEVAQRVGAQYIVSGTVRVVGTRIRLSAELMEVSGGTVLWSRAYDAFEPLEFDTQDDIAGSIARTLVPHLRNEELRRSRGHQPENLNAYRLMLQARELIFTLERPAFEQAGELLQEALRLDPGYAPIHMAVANWHSLRIGQGWTAQPEADERALEAMARKAIALDPANGRALAMLAHNRTILRREYDEAITLLDRALGVSPNDAEALMWSGPTYAYMGEPAEALRRVERAISLSPEDPFMFRYEHFMSIAHYSAGNYEEAARWGTKSLRRNPYYTSNLRLTAASLAGAGRAADARPLVQRAMQLQPGFHVLPMIEKQAFRSDEQRERWARHLTEAGLPP
jgi:DNA-binding SARP family transcriptional activator/TolB-like protein